jgi:hypothetical protein
MSNGNTPEHEGFNATLKTIPRRIGEMATVEISSQIQASGALVEVGPKDRGTVDLGGRQVSGTLIPSVRRLTLGLPETDIEQETNDEDPSPC